MHPTWIERYALMTLLDKQRETLAACPLSLPRIEEKVLAMRRVQGFLCSVAINRLRGPDAAVHGDLLSEFFFLAERSRYIGGTVRVEQLSEDCLESMPTSRWLSLCLRLIDHLENIRYAFVEPPKTVANSLVYPQDRQYPAGPVTTTLVAPNWTLPGILLRWLQDEPDSSAVLSLAQSLFPNVPLEVIQQWPHRERGRFLGDSAPAWSDVLFEERTLTVEQCMDIGMSGYVRAEYDETLESCVAPETHTWTRLPLLVQMSDGYELFHGVESIRELRALVSGAPTASRRTHGIWASVAKTHRVWILCNLRS